MVEHRETWPVAVLGAVFEVSRSGFYAYLQRHASPIIDRQAVELVARVKAMAAQTRHSDGSRRMAKHLQAEGWVVGRYKARRVMQAAGERCAAPRTVGRSLPTVAMAMGLPRICWRGSVMSSSRIRSGWEISPIAGRPRAGYLSPSGSTCTRVQSWGGPCGVAWMPPWSRRCCGWLANGGTLPQGCSTMRIAGVHMPVRPTKNCLRPMGSAVA